MNRRSLELENEWPNLNSEGYEIKSKKTLLTDPNCEHYNCIAFAADIETAWWEPDQGGVGAWPISKREYTLQCYTEAYEAMGYEVCPESNIEIGFEKIVLYALRNEPTHAAKQLPDGRWKSKLGQLEDIEHNTPKALEGEKWYGTAVRYMRRRIANA
jgi:hypothetical protein